MDTQTAIDMSRDMIWTALLISMPVLTAGVAIGLVVGLLQALTTRFQPLSRTNNISLNGSEIIAGGSIIIPIDTITLAITMSRIKNGKNI